MTSFTMDMTLLLILNCVYLSLSTATVQGQDQILGSNCSHMYNFVRRLGVNLDLTQPVLFDGEETVCASGRPNCCSALVEDRIAGKALEEFRTIIESYLKEPGELLNTYANAVRELHIEALTVSLRAVNSSLASAVGPLKTHVVKLVDSLHTSLVRSFLDGRQSVHVSSNSNNPPSIDRSTGIHVTQFFKLLFVDLVSLLTNGNRTTSHVNCLLDKVIWPRTELGVRAHKLSANWERTVQPVFATINALRSGGQLLLRSRKLPLGTGCRSGLLVLGVCSLCAGLEPSAPCRSLCTRTMELCVQSIVGVLNAPWRELIGALEQVFDPWRLTFLDIVTNLHREVLQIVTDFHLARAELARKASTLCPLGEPLVSDNVRILWPYTVSDLSKEKRHLAERLATFSADSVQKMSVLKNVWSGLQASLCSRPDLAAPIYGPGKCWNGVRLINLKDDIQEKRVSNKAPSTSRRLAKAQVSLRQAAIHLRRSLSPGLVQGQLPVKRRRFVDTYPASGNGPLKAQTLKSSAFLTTDDEDGNSEGSGDYWGYDDNGVQREVMTIPPVFRPKGAGPDWTIEQFVEDEYGRWRWVDTDTTTLPTTPTTVTKSTVPITTEKLGSTNALNRSSPVPTSVPNGTGALPISTDSLVSTNDFNRSITVPTTLPNSTDALSISSESTNPLNRSRTHPTTLPNSTDALSISSERLVSTNPLNRSRTLPTSLPNSTDALSISSERLANTNNLTSSRTLPTTIPNSTDAVPISTATVVTTSVYRRDGHQPPSFVGNGKEVTSQPMVTSKPNNDVTSIQPMRLLLTSTWLVFLFIIRMRV